MAVPEAVAVHHDGAAGDLRLGLVGDHREDLVDDGKRLQRMKMTIGSASSGILSCIVRIFTLCVISLTKRQNVYQSILKLSV